MMRSTEGEVDAVGTVQVERADPIAVSLVAARRDHLVKCSLACLSSFAGEVTDRRAVAVG